MNYIPWVGLAIVCSCSNPRDMVAQVADGHDSDAALPNHGMDASPTAHEGGLAESDSAEAIAKRRERPGYQVVANPLRPCRTSVTSSQNLTFAERRGDTGLLPQVPFSAAVGLVDGDDVLDLVLQSSVSNGDVGGQQVASVYSSKHQYAIALGPFEVGGSTITLADVNADGLHDSANGSLVALANVDGAFEPRQRIGEWNGLNIWADFNQDSILETAFGRPGGALEVSMGLGDLQFAEPVRTDVDISALAEAAVSDINGDGEADLVGLMRSGPPDEPHDSLVTVLFGDGEGRFSEPEQAFVLSEFVNTLKIGDFNCDGLGDVVLFGDINPVHVLLRVNDGWGDSVELYTHPDDMGSGPGSVSGAVADVNGDGAHDLVTSTILFTVSHEPFGGMAVFYGEGTGSFSALQYIEPTDDRLWGFITAGDLNGDGLDDFITSYATDGSTATSEFSIWTTSL